MPDNWIPIEYGSSPEVYLVKNVGEKIVSTSAIMINLVGYSFASDHSFEADFNNRKFIFQKHETI
jgi:hypothetical protein